ncbi:MAG TPA: deoxyribonuclease IV [Thermoleophilaceae bacterium]|nr:deoxyribonuclease IV [Thermoleophilaceae bacterium]
MLIGAHVSTAGGLVNAHERGVERGCEAIQVFNQSPRMWRPTQWKPNDIEAFCALMEDGPIKSVVIHAVYLINCATKDKEMRKKSLASLTHSLRMGDAIGADGVVVHPGSRLKDPLDEALGRVAEMVREALAESESCRLLLENTAGAGATIGRSFAELYEIVGRAGGDERIGICLDSCHMYASGFDISDDAGLEEVIDDCVSELGLERVGCIHVNDSQTPLGSNRDRHAPPGDGELGDSGCSAFLSEPRFEGLAAFFEGPGVEGRDPGAADIAKMRELRKKGLARRKRRASRAKK